MIFPKIKKGLKYSLYFVKLRYRVLDENKLLTELRIP